MNRNEKQAVIDSVKKDFASAQSSFVIGVKGLTVEAVQGLRKELFPQGGKLKVTKNTLLKLATEGMPGVSELAPYFKDQIAIVFADDNTPAVAKMLKETRKKNELLTILAGSLDNKVISAADIDALASLPSREVLLAQVLGTMNAPVTSFVSILNQLVVRLLWVLKKIEENKQ